MAQQHGDILWFSRRTWRKNTVVLNSSETVREAFSKGGAFAGRSPNFSLSLVSNNYKEALKIMHERNWKILRRFAHKSLLKRAIKHEHIDKIIHDEVQKLVDRLIEQSGKTIDATFDLMLTVVNISAILVFGERFEKDDERFECVKNILSKTFSKSKQGDTLKEFIKNIWGQLNTKESHDSELMLESFIRKHLAKKNNNLPDIIDEVIKCIEDEQHRFNIKGEETKYLVAFSVVFEVFFSSLEPVLASLQWSLLYLARWNQYQDKINGRNQNENRKINKDMLNAVIHETQRLAVVVPLYPRACAEDSTIKGHLIKKDTTVLINTYALHYDADIWKNPKKFCPERWLNTDSSFQKVNSHSFIPFGGGQRRCVGEQLAGMELSIILEKLLTSFEIIEPQLNNLDLVEGTFNVPQTFQLVFQKR